MDEPIVTAAAPPPKVKNLAQQETDFTSEGSPPPGVVGPMASQPAVAVTTDHRRERQAKGTIARTPAPVAAPDHEIEQGARSAVAPRQR
jgi:hypothetical protein